MPSSVEVHTGLASLIRAERFGDQRSDRRVLVVTSGVKGLAVLGRRFAEVAVSAGAEVSIVVSPPALVRRRPIRRPRPNLSLIEQVRHRRRWRNPAETAADLTAVLARFDGVFVAGTGPAFPFSAVIDRAEIQSCLLFDVTMNGHAEQNGWKENRLFRGEVRSEAACFGSFDRLISVSNWARESAINDLGIEADRIAAIPPVLARHKAPAVIERHPGGVVKLVSAGSPWVRKGMDLTVDWLNRRPDAAVELHLFGDAPVDIEDQRVVRHGMIDGAELISTWLPRMDLLVHPTRRDQSSTIAVEAAWAGVPTLATAMGGIPDLIDHGSTGWLLPNPPAPAMDGILDDLVANPARLVAAGVAARRKAELEFDADVAYGPFASWLAGVGPEPEPSGLTPR